MIYIPVFFHSGIRIALVVSDRVLADLLKIYKNMQKEVKKQKNRIEDQIN